jgi:hypothetical protein
MMPRRSAVVGLAFVAWALVWPVGPRASAGADTLPARFTDQEFWKLSDDFSEPNGYFRSDNLLSNEIGLQTVIPDLLRRAKPGAVYLGVGPEQNFTYIVALKPKLVFITDIRRGNLHMHLMYKALFEMSADRADFVSKLFSKKRPDGLTTKSSAADIFTAYWNLPTSDDLYKTNLQAIQDSLARKHGSPLSADDVKGVEYVYWSFYWYGPSINYNSSSGNGNGRGGGNMVDYSSLMMADDGTGLNRGYLGSEENFLFMKDLESKNLLVPFVGNFAGPKALRAEGKWLKEHGATVAAFYLSNVEQYLVQDGIWQNFCANVASLPLDDSSTFIRSGQGGYGGGGRGGGLMSSLGAMFAETKGCGGGRPVAPGAFQPGR